MARGSQRPIDVEPLAVDAHKFKKTAAYLVPTIKRQLKSIKGGDLHPGDCVSIDQYVSSHITLKESPTTYHLETTYMGSVGHPPL